MQLQNAVPGRNRELPEKVPSDYARLQIVVEKVAEADILEISGLPAPKRTDPLIQAWQLFLNTARAPSGVSSVIRVR